VDQNVFEQRREQVDYTEALRATQREAGFTEKVSGEKLPGAKQGGLPMDAQITVGGKAKQNKATPGGGEMIDQFMQPVYEAGGKVNKVLGQGVSAAGSILGLDQPSADFAGDVIGYQAPENSIDTGLMALPFLGGAIKGVKKGAQAGKKAKDAAETVQHSTVPAIQSEQDLRKVVDAPGSDGKTFVVLTDQKGKLKENINPNYKIGDLSNVMRRAGYTEQYQTIGMYEGKAEPSIMFVSPKPNDVGLITKAQQIAKVSGQESILTSEGLMYQDGTINPRKGPSTYGEEAKLLKDGHSVVIAPDGSELPFAMSIDWGTVRQAAYEHNIKGLSFNPTRYNYIKGLAFVDQLPKGVSVNSLPKHEQEFRLPATSVYDFQDNHLNLPTEGYEETLKSSGYKAALLSGEQGPYLNVVDSVPVHRSIVRPGVVTTYPEKLPDRIEAGTFEDGQPDPQTRKDLVDVGTAVLMQPELTTAKQPVASGTTALGKGEKKTFQVRTGQKFAFNGADNMSDENIQDALAYLSAKDVGTTKPKYASQEELNAALKQKAITPEEHDRESALLKVHTGWKNLITQVESQFDDIAKTGLKVQHVSGQPYQTAAEMLDDVKNHNTLKISTDFNEHPIFTPEQNLKFRAVHDYYGHVQTGSDFSMAGEKGTFDAHAKTLYGQDAINALRVEVLGQASSMLAKGGEFPKQKIFDLEKQREKLGLVEGASTDLFASWVREMEKRLPENAQGQIGLDHYRGIFNESVTGYKKFLDQSMGQIPNTKYLLGLMNDSHGRSIQEWYRHARQELDRQFGPDADLMAKFIALFSPQADVQMNVDRAYAAYKAYKLGNRDAHSVARAAGIDKPEKYAAITHNLQRVLNDPTVELSGRKVSNYLKAINGDMDAVVIDRHMAGIFGIDNVTEEWYTIIEEHIRMLAAETGMAPADAQAVLWGSWKALKGQAKELKNLDKFLKELGDQEGFPKLEPPPGTTLDEEGHTRLAAAWFLSKVMGGAAIGGAQGDNPGEQIRNALIGSGLGVIANKPLWDKVGKAMREAAPNKWFRPASTGAPTPAPVQPLTPDQILKQADEAAAQKARLEALRDKPKTVTVGTKTYELDMKSLDSPESIKQAVDEMAKVYREQIDAGTLPLGSRGVIPNALARRLGEHLNLSEADVLNRVRGSVGPVEHVFAYADVLDAAKARAMQSLEFFNAGQRSFEGELIRDVDTYAKVGSQLDGLLEELGRGLQAAGQPDVKALTGGFRAFQGPFELMQKHGSVTGDSIAALVKEIGLNKTAALGSAVQKAGLWDMVAEVTYGFVLSNPVSAMANLGSGIGLNPIMTTLARGMAEMGGSGAVASGETRAMLFGYMNGAERMMKAVAQTYGGQGAKQGAINLMLSVKSVGPVGKSSDKSGFTGREGAISGKNVSALLPKPFQFDPNGMIGKFVDAAGSAVRFGPTLMELGDHLSYAVNLDMAMSARAFREGTKLGKQGADLQNFINTEMLNPSREIRQEAEQFAMHEIFKAPIEGAPGKITEGLNHPAMRPFITFVNTPVNIFKYNLEGVPGLNLALKGVREDLMAGGARRDLAKAKMILGGTMAGVAAMYAAQDRLTGNGPVDPKLRHLWLIDHQPYSLKLPGTDEWVSYKRFDPVASWFGMAADAKHFMEFDKEDLTGGEMAMATVLGFMRNFTDKTYSRDTFEFLDQLTVRPGEDATNSLKSLERYLDKKTTSYVPWSSLSRAVRQSVDPFVREAFDLQEKVMDTIPGFSQRLPIKLDFYGDPITKPRYNAFLPFPLKDDTGDDVTDELIRIRAGVGMPSKVFDGEDLTSQEYHDLVHARGKEVVGFNGHNLRDGLIDLFNSPDYRSEHTTDAMRKLMVEKLVEAYNLGAVDYMAQGGKNQRFLQYRQAQKKAEALTGQTLNLNFGQ
jgi:hypothetical protein